MWSQPQRTSSAIILVCILSGLFLLALASMRYSASRGVYRYAEVKCAAIASAR